MKQLAVLTLLLATLGVTLPAAAQAATTTPAATALTAAQISAIDNAALNWAETQTGKPYIYGGTGPAGYDCSGLVMMAFRHAGVYLPRTTYEMLASPLLIPIPVSQARRGDLLFYGPGHVEFDTIWYHQSFGAHDTGSRIGWIQWGPYWYPTMAFRVA